MKLKSKLTLSCCFLCLMSGSVLAQTVISLINPGFETNTDGTVFAVKVSAGFDVLGNDVAGWTDAGMGNNSSGVDYNGDNGLTSNSGSVCAWSVGGNPGAYQITGYQIQSGDQLTLTWWAKCTYGPSGNADQKVELLGATNVTDAFTNLPVLATSIAPLNNTGNGGAYTKYTLNYIANDADAGKYVAVFFCAFSGGNKYAAFDDFSLTVQPNQNLPVLGNAVAAPNPCYALSPVTLTNNDSGTGIGTTYQWQTNSDLSGGLTGTWGNIPEAVALTASITPPDINPGEANYTLDCQLVASNAGGSVTSAPVALVVMPAAMPVVTEDITPESANINAGGQVSFTATFTGTLPITYQWQTDAGQTGVFTNIPFATNLILTLVNPLIGNYQLVATNILGSATTSAANVTVNPVYFGNLLINPGFETNTAGTVFGAKVFQGFDMPGNDVAGWSNTGTNYGDSGVDFAGDNGLTVVSGEVAAYLHTGDDGAYQITGYPVQAGDQLTLTWWAKSTYLTGAQQVQLLSATNPTDAYTNLTVLATSTDPLYYSGNGADYFQYTLTYTATAADDGKLIAVSFLNNGAANSYAAFDDFNLTVLQSTPTLNINNTAGGQLKLTWLDGVLLEAPDISGPWTTNIYAVSPFTIIPVGPHKFYRTQLQ
jgi:hypothetical protein